MRRNDVLIREARDVSRNTLNPDSTYSISDDEILRYLNDAQDRMQNLISSQKNIARIFATQQIISLVANQEGYSVPDRVLLNKQIEMVEFSNSGLVTDYVPLRKLEMFNRSTYTNNYPWGYYKRGGQIFLVNMPSVSSGTLRITYERTLDDLDIPRGVISSITTGTSTDFAALVFDSTANAYESTTPGWSNIQYCSIVDANGVRKAFNIPVGSYNTGTNTMTPTGSLFTYTSNDVQVAVGDVAVFNKYTTTFSQLPDECERYLIHSAALDLFAKDSSVDYAKEADKVAKIEEDTLAAVSSQTAEVQYIPEERLWEWY